MMIKKLEIQDYRSCLNTTFNMDPNLSVLIGPNGSGKSNILNAILLLKKLTQEEAYYRNERLPTTECKLKVWFDLDGKTIIFTAKVNIFTDENNKDVVVGSKQQWYLKDFTGSAKRLGIPLTLARHIGPHGFGHGSRLISRREYFEMQDIEFEMENIPTKQLNDIAQLLSGIRYYSASQFTNPSNCPVSFEIERVGEKSTGVRLRGHAKFLYDLYSAFKAKSDDYKQFFDIVGPDGIGLIDALDFNEFITSSIAYTVRSGGKVRKRKRNKSLIIPQFNIGKDILSPNQLSEGTFKTITLLFYLVTESSSILLVEEPEVCVHHGLLCSIIEIIKTYSSEKQIVLSTHSDYVLDQVSPENVHRIYRDSKAGTEIKHITKSMSREELAALRDYLDTEGNLGEYWRHGALEA